MVARVVPHEVDEVARRTQLRRGAATPRRADAVRFLWTEGAWPMRRGPRMESGQISSSSMIWKVFAMLARPDAAQLWTTNILSKEDPPPDAASMSAAHLCS